MGLDVIELTVKKKPCTVEAMQFFDDPELVLALKTWMGIDPLAVSYETGKARLKIPTLEGPHYASEGDYIIRGVNGEYYPCKPDIFWKTYEIEKSSILHYNEDDLSVEEDPSEVVCEEDLNV